MSTLSTRKPRDVVELMASRMVIQRALVMAFAACSAAVGLLGAFEAVYRAVRAREVAYIAARCAPHRERYFLALEAALGAEALGACAGRNASGAEGPAAQKTGGRLEADYMDDAVRGMGLRVRKTVLRRARGPSLLIGLHICVSSSDY